MLIVHVQVRVKPEAVEDFLSATLDNAQASLKEPGMVRFDILQDERDKSRFVLVEAFRDLDAPAAHKETAHYRRWRDRVADMMAEPRQSTKFHNLFPADRGWELPDS